jgi:hypothetical protein
MEQGLKAFSGECFGVINEVVPENKLSAGYWLDCCVLPLTVLSCNGDGD